MGDCNAIKRDLRKILDLFFAHRSQTSAISNKQGLKYQILPIAHKIHRDSANSPRCIRMDVVSRTRDD